MASGKDLSQFAQEILRYFRNLLVIKSGAPEDLLALPEDEIALMKEAAQRFTLTELIRLVEQFSDMANAFDSQLAQRTALETLLIRLATRTVDVSLDSVLEKLALLSEGVVLPASTSTQQTAQSASGETPKKKVPAKPGLQKYILDSKTNFRSYLLVLVEAVLVLQ